MERRFVLFLVLSLVILVGSQYLMSILYPVRPGERPPVAKQAEGEKGKAGDAAPKAVGKKETKAGPKSTAQPEAKQPKPDEAKPAKREEPKAIAAEPDPPQEWVALGSVDPASPYRMLVTLTNRGAAVAAIELNSPRFRDLDDPNGFYYERSGYLGRVVLDEDVRGAGCPVQVVGLGTPAEAAGLKPGDLIKAVDSQRVTGPVSLRAALEGTRPNQTVTLAVARNGKDLSLQATLGERPLAIIRPEANDPLSFLLTLSQIDKEGLNKPADAAEQGIDLEAEIKGIALRHGNWTIDRKSQSDSQVTFVRKLPKWGLEITKTYRLAQVPAESADDPSYQAYHLEFEVKIHNTGGASREVAYQLDGPNGLPIEGWWYSNKVSRNWGSAGVRDVVVSFSQSIPKLVSCQKIADNAVDALPWREEPLSFIGVDAQYFTSVVIPQMENPTDVWFSESRPMTVGAVDRERMSLANTSFRLTSTVRELQPGATFGHKFKVFAGPKKPALLAQYGLDEVVYYGWFGWAAKPLVAILHFFYAIVGNYGLAIILLTVLVRGCMFPLSRKQTLNALKMQELQPEIKKIQEKHKKDMEGRTRAQQELFRKHNYNPLGGCLVMFIQLPIFVALYRALMVDVELRQAPLLSEAIRWCSNLAAPDMFLDWSGFTPGFINSGTGLFGLGPYLNILPIVTIFLFLWQQKKLMPPPADEQAAMQQSMMKYMMIFMGLLFFKVASGLCIYFIASSVWGLAERRFLPKAKSPDDPSGGAAGTATRGFFGRTGSNGDGDVRKKKKRGSRGKR
jgi:YidC/Oxa1 family membrane protein insertase